MIEVGEREVGVGMDESVLVEEREGVDVGEVEGVMRGAIRGTIGLEIGMRLVIGFRVMERRE